MGNLHPHVLGAITLESVNRLGGYKAAGHELSLTVAGVSLRIQRFETALDRILVAPPENDTRRRELTPDGLLLVKALSPLRAWAEDIATSAMSERSRLQLERENSLLKQLLAEAMIEKVVRKKATQNPTQSKRL